MRKRNLSPERNVMPGTEYARSIARYAPRSQPSTIGSLLSHPIAPAIALGLFAAGVALLWPRPAHGLFGSKEPRRAMHDGDAEYADFPPRRHSASVTGYETGRGSMARTYTSVEG